MLHLDTGNTGFMLLCSSLVMLRLIDRVTPVRVQEEQEQMGLDAALHGEQAYVELA